MKLVIAEKPSVAQSIAAVLGARNRKEGFLEGCGWRVSWCIGHLVELADAKEYDPRFSKWRREDLPILPDPWKTVVSSEKKEQYEILRKLMNAADVEEVINACDAGREGELIFRSVYELAGCRKPMKRLWISSMEDSAIRKGFENLRPGAEYDRLYDAALCRSRADWLVGINATRLFSVLYGKTLNIGRVMSPALSLVVQREQTIRDFHSEPFYVPVLKLPGFEAAGEKLPERQAAERIASACRGKPVVVSRVERKEKSERAPALYDLTTLQRDANRLLGYTAQQTLDLLQSLYEKKLCTYPRTDSRYLTSDMEEGLPELAELTMQFLGFNSPVICHAGQVINDKKVSDHHAVIPTRSLMMDGHSALETRERAILDLVAVRFLCAVGDPFRYESTEVLLTCGENKFTAKEKTVLSMGWRELSREKQQLSDRLAGLQEGQQLTAETSVTEGKTKPLAHFTEDTLLSAMENAGETVEGAERKGLGTPATRAGILEKLVSTGFVQRKKVKKAVQLIPSQDACNLMQILPEQLQSPDLTAQWEAELVEIERGNGEMEVFLRDISTMVTHLVEEIRISPGMEHLFQPPRVVVGRCPRCGAEVEEGPKGFFCRNKDCGFAIWKKNRWWEQKKKQPTRPLVKALLEQGRAPVKGLYSAKTGKFYDAIIVLEDDGSRPNFRLSFESDSGTA